MEGRFVSHRKMGGGTNCLNQWACPVTYKSLHYPMTQECFFGNSALSNTAALLFSTLTSG